MRKPLPDARRRALGGSRGSVSAGRVHRSDEVYLVESHFDSWLVIPMNPVARASSSSEDQHVYEFEHDGLVDLSPEPTHAGDLTGAGRQPARQSRPLPESLSPA